MIAPRVLEALAAPTIGHLDPYLLELYAEEQALLQQVFQTGNEWTFSISGTGTAGMETVLVNLIEPGDFVLCAVKGYFGERLAEIATRCGAAVDRIWRPWGETFTVEEFEYALTCHKYKLVTLVHTETSTGAVQGNIREIADVAHKHDALLVLDTVTSLGGVTVDIDAWGIDAAYAASQKCLSVPPGLSPLTIGERARQVIEKRTRPVHSFYLDLNQYASYWNGAHGYHHTASSNLHYAMREGLRMLLEEGLENCFSRHKSNAEALWAGLEVLGFPPLIPEFYRSPVLTTPRIPVELEEARIRARLLNEYNIEIAGGFGDLRGKVWRIGLMGHSSRLENVTILLDALKKLIRG